jgi:hypothetical protein
MKIGTFVMGGLAGAAVVMMMRRNQNMSSITNGMGQMMKQRMNDVKENVIQRGIDLKFSNGSMGSSSNKNSKSSNSSNSNNSSNNNNNSNKQSASFKSKTDGLDKVEDIASRDPHVKHEINDILEENGQHRI